MAERVLYHYTSAGGLLGIIESGTLWASDCRFLNDATELSYSTEQLLAALSTLEDDTMGPESGFILPGVVEHLTAETFRVHVVCFCEDGDLLSQWRAYGADGGYAVGFASDRLWNSGPQAILSDGGTTSRRSHERDDDHHGPAERPSLDHAAAIIFGYFGLQYLWRGSRTRDEIAGGLSHASQANRYRAEMRGAISRGDMREVPRIYGRAAMDGVMLDPKDAERLGYREQPRGHDETR